MKKIYIAALLGIVVVTGVVLLNSSTSNDYVVTIYDEVGQLEAELMLVEKQITAGTLTTEQATEAKVSILNRLDKINASANTQSTAKLTDAQKLQLNEGLNRLKQILITYQSTLSTVDKQAIESQVQSKRKSSGGSNSKLSQVVIATIEAVEDVTEEVVVDYEPDEILDEQIEEIEETVTVDESSNNEEEDSEAEMTENDNSEAEEMTDDSDSDSKEEVSEDEAQAEIATSTEETEEEISI